MNDDLTPFDLSFDELKNIDKTVETLRAEILAKAKAGEEPSVHLLHRLKKAYLLKEEKDFNNRYPYETT